MSVSLRAFFAPVVAAFVLLASAAHAVPILDITNPGDAIFAIDLDNNSSSPAGEEAVFAIDDNIGMKYLNFGETNSGFIVIPSNNPVTHALRGLTITTANDAVERDPTSFEVYGTNDAIMSIPHSDGSAENWTLIAGGDLLLPDARQTVGPTAAFFNNTHYQSFRVVFPTVKNEAGANSMQIAEIRLDAVDIGTPFIPPPIDDVTMPGDFIIAVDLDGNSSSPGGEPSPLAIDNNTGTKYLNFGEEFSGLIVTPSNNPDNYAVTSLTITTANDAEDRDPTSFILFGTNDAISSADHSTGDGEFWELIAQGVLDLPAARNTVGPTVMFDNETHYDSFRLIFPTVKNAGTANSMQIAEIQLGATAFIADVPEPGTAVLGLIGLVGLAARRRPRRA